MSPRNGSDPRPPLPPWPLELEPAEVRARFARARREGRGRYVWADLPVGEWRAALRELESAVGAALAGRPATVGMGGAGARALGIAAFTSGAGPLLGRWVEDGVVEAPAAVADLLRLHLWHGRERAVRQAEHLERVATALAAAGIRALVVKSAHVGREYYPEPGARPAVDVDVVVAPAEYERASEALAGAGLERAARQHRPAKSDWLPPGVEPWPRSLELLHAGSHYGVDLQSSLARNFFGVRTVRLSGVESAPRRPVAGLPSGMTALGQPELLAYQALHASEGLHSATLIRLVDLVLIARRDEAAGSLDWSDFRALLESCGGARFAYPALKLAERLAPGTVPVAVLEGLERAAPGGMRAVVAAVSPGTAQRPEVLSLRERFMWCATPLDYGRRVAHMLVPAPAGRSPAHLASHYIERAYRLLRGRVRLNAEPESRRSR